MPPSQRQRDVPAPNGLCSGSCFQFCAARKRLARLGAKWSIPVLITLEGAPSKRMRFSELKSQLDGVSQRMLTVTLRGLESDGLLLKRRLLGDSFKCEYALSPLGQSTLRALRCFARSAVPCYSKISAPHRAYVQGRKTRRNSGT